MLLKIISWKKDFDRLLAKLPWKLLFKVVDVEYLTTRTSDHMHKLMVITKYGEERMAKHKKNI